MTNLICDHHQRRISAALDEGGELADRTRRHLERCEACRRFQRRAAHLEGLLRGPTPDAARPDLPDARQAWLRRLRPLAAAAGLAAAIALGWSLLAGGEEPPPPAPVVARAPAPAVPAALFSPAEAVATPWEGLAGGSDPLTRGVGHVAGDVRAAVATMISYLPAPPRRAQGTPSAPGGDSDVRLPRPSLAL
jgi:hypothetical protein